MLIYLNKMKYPIIDTHTHSYFPSIEKDQAEIFQKCNEAGVEIQVQIGCDEMSSIAGLNLAKANEGFFTTVGLHPCDVRNIGVFDPKYHRYANMENIKPQAKNFDELFEIFGELFEQNKEKVVGFGETGFDLYHENSHEILELQKESFSRHLNLCQKYNKPVVIHTRNAHKVTLEFLEQELPKRKNIRGVVHCFCEDSHFAEIVTKKYGLFIGIGGVLTYNNTEKIREAVKNTPIEYIVTETDSPFLVPRKAKNRKNKINHSGLLPEVIELIAELKKMDIEECGKILFENGKRLYGI